MKNRKAYLPLALILLLIALAFTACGGKGGGAGEQPTPTGGYDISFSVNGVVTTQTVVAGEIPVFLGSTEKAPDIEGEKYYHFTGWDKPLSAATENVTYTAVYEELPLSTVMWDIHGGIQKSYTGEGLIPTPPDGATDVKMTNDTVKTFVRWDKEIVAATAGTNLYKAIYSDATRYYTVSFKVNGAEVATGKSEYNQLAYKAYAGGAKIPSGYGDIMWIDGSFKVTDDTAVVNGLYVATNGTVLSMSYPEKLLGYTATGSDNAGSVYASATAVIHMLHEVRATRNPDSTTELLANLCADHLKNLVNAPDAAPYFDLAPTWSYVPLTGAILIAKETPAVWDKLSALEKEKLDFVMEVFAYVLALGTDDNNNYKTGPGMMGNYLKSWNPNYRLANVIPMVFAGRYLGGAEKVNTLLHAFSFDATMAKFDTYGFTRAKAQWGKPNPIHPETGATLPGPKEFMENGGPAYTKLREDSAGDRLDITEGKEAGSGVGVRTDYTYGGMSVDNIAGIVNKVFDYNYSGGPVTSSKDNDGDGKPDAYIMDGTGSPVLGMEGMMREFNSGTRSSVSYCKDDFMMVVTILFIFGELDLYDLSDDPARLRMVWIGNTDFLYKYEHGYMSVSNASSAAHAFYEKTVALYYYIWKDEWLSGIGKLKLEQLPRAPAVFNPVMGSEDFSETVLNLAGASQKIGRISFGAGKTGAAMKTVAAADGNTYLLFTLAANGGDPALNISGDGGPAALLGEYTSFTISFDLARQTGVATPAGSLYIRESASKTNTRTAIMNLSSDGEVKVLGTKVTTLTEVFQTISLTVDFAKGTVTGYVDGVEKTSGALTVPAASEATTPLEWLSLLGSYIFNWQFNKPGATDRALLLDNISAIVDVPDAGEEPEDDPTEGDSET